MQLRRVSRRLAILEFDQGPARGKKQPWIIRFVAVHGRKLCKQLLRKYESVRSLQRIRAMMYVVNSHGSQTRHVSTTSTTVSASFEGAPRCAAWVALRCWNDWRALNGPAELHINLKCSKHSRDQSGLGGEV